MDSALAIMPPDRHPFAVRLVDRNRHGQFGLALLEPNLSRRLAVERLAFLINCLSLLHDADLCGICCRAILALANGDRAHGFCYMNVRCYVVATNIQKQAKTVVIGSK